MQKYIICSYFYPKWKPEFICFQDLLYFSRQETFSNLFCLIIQEDIQVRFKIQGDTGPENVDTTEAVSSLRWEARLSRGNIFSPCAFPPSFMKDMPCVAELMLFDPKCWIPRESLLFKGIALLSPPFKLLFEGRLLLVPGLDVNKFSCSTITWLCTFFLSYVKVTI